jgi:hypothetical protein
MSAVRTFRYPPRDGAASDLAPHESGKLCFTTDARDIRAAIPVYTERARGAIPRIKGL